MNLSAIKILLERKLMVMPGVLPSAWENIAFDPPSGPYQSCHHLINSPVELSLEGTLTEERGILQITLRYPLGGGRQACDAMVDQIRSHFKVPQLLWESDFRIELNKTPSVASGMPDEGRWNVPISIYWRAFPS